MIECLYLSWTFAYYSAAEAPDATGADLQVEDGEDGAQPKTKNMKANYHLIGKLNKAMAHTLHTMYFLDLRHTR